MATHVFMRESGVDVVPIHIIITSPFQDRTTGELGPIVTENASWLSRGPRLLSATRRRTPSFSSV